MSTRGFTLIEMLVVIAIIAINASILYVDFASAREKALVASTAALIRRMDTSVLQYTLATGYIPPACRIQEWPGDGSPGCTAANDPLLNDLGVAGWKGPYGRIYDAEHAWGGHLGLERADCLDGNGDVVPACNPPWAGGDGIDDIFFVLDDDPPGGYGTAGSPNALPPSGIELLDILMDDGNTTTGQFRSEVAGVSTGVGSAVWILSANQYK